MKHRLSDQWKQDMTRELDSYSDTFSQVPIVCETSNNIAIRFLILGMLERNIAYKIINLGVGIKRLTTVTDTCPKCKGSGRV